MFEAKKRFELAVLNYMVTSDHIHMLVKDTGGRVIPQSMQLIAGRTAQELNGLSSGDIATLREQAWCKLHQPKQPEK
jgi:REP element-mobilizing transposase RayT